MVYKESGGVPSLFLFISQMFIKIPEKEKLLVLKVASPILIFILLRERCLNDLINQDDHFNFSDEHSITEQITNQTTKLNST